jgi:iron complex transport system ATP-binding protein
MFDHETTSMKANVLECKSVSVIYNELVALDKVSLSIKAGDFLGIVGPNGAGKSTLIKVMSGLLEPDTGNVNLSDINLRSLSRQVIARELAVVVQEENSEFGFNVEQYVALGRSPHHGGLYFEGSRDREIVLNALRRTHTERLASRDVNSLSGGERQHVRIARALAQEPNILILDEPTNHLDIFSQMNLGELLRNINMEGIAIVMVSHDINFMCQACNQLKLMSEGKIIAEGIPGEVITENSLAEAFKVKALVDINPVTKATRITPYAKI